MKPAPSKHEKELLVVVEFIGDVHHVVKYMVVVARVVVLLRVDGTVGL